MEPLRREGCEKALPSRSFASFAVDEVALLCRQGIGMSARRVGAGDEDGLGIGSRHVMGFSAHGSAAPAAVAELDLAVGDAGDQRAGITDRVLRPANTDRRGGRDDAEILLGVATDG